MESKSEEDAKEGRVHKVMINEDEVPNRRHFTPRVNEQDDEGETPLLEPDHPLLEKFQRALKEHLERQIEHLSAEVFELETATKKKNQQREQLGVEVYEVQQLVSQQQVAIDNCVGQLDNMTKERENIEYDLKKSYETYKIERNKLLEAEQRERELRNEVEAMNHLTHQMVKWENDIESELSTNQRISEKTKKDKARLAEEKRTQDMFIYRLMTEVWKLEGELETLDMQLRVKEEEREKLAEAVANYNTDLEAVESEYRCLLNSWNSVIVTISNRDKYFNAITRELEANQNKVRNMMAEIDQTKKMCNKEMLRNESLTMIKHRVDNEIKMALSQMNDENRKRNMLERQSNSLQTVIDQTEKDIQRVNFENNQKKTALNLSLREFEKLTQEKVVLEEKILAILETQLTNDKASKYLKKILKQVKEKNADLEITLMNNENKNARVLMDTEAQKCMNEETQRLLDELHKQLSLIDAEITDYEEQMKKASITISKKQRDVGILTKKIEVVQERLGNTEIPAEAIKMQALERDIEELQEKIKELQRFWLREQGHVVSLSQQRQDQIYEFNLLKKQMLILEQKNLKLTDELDGHNKHANSMNRNINNLQNRLLVLNESLCKKRGCKERLDKDNDSTQNEFVHKLKDAELECLKLEAEIIEIEEEKVTLSEELIERNREALSWEKKVQMANETKQIMDKEKGTGGEIGNMKSEIHRMEVRYMQLRKAQDKLIQDLEHCVSRRDAILTMNEAREKCTVGATEKTRINFARKLDDLKNKFKQLTDEVDIIKDKLMKEDEKEKKIKEDEEILQKEIKQLKNKDSDLNLSIEKATTDKLLKLEMLVLKQKKLNMFSDVIKGRTPYTLYRTDTVLSQEYQKQRSINGKLVTIVDNLMADFPNHQYEFLRLFNSLKLPIFVMLP